MFLNPKLHISAHLKISSDPCLFYTKNFSVLSSTKWSNFEGLIWWKFPFISQNFYFKFTWSLTLWFYTFKLSNNASHFFACHLKTRESLSVLSRQSDGEFFLWNNLSSKFFVSDSHWSNIWSQLKIFKCFLEHHAKYSKIKWKQKFQIPTIQILSCKVPVKLVLKNGCFPNEI